MRVRQLDAAHDWTFGKGQNNYLRDQRAVQQNLDTRLNSFLGNCFFDEGAGIDWFNFLGSKDQLGLILAIKAVILNTEAVTALVQLSVDLSVARVFTVRYQVQTTFSVLSSQFQLNTNLVG